MNSSWLSHIYIYTYVHLYICIHIYMYVYLFIYDVGIVGRGANVTLQTLNLRRNNINSSACFVFANVLSTHPSMCQLDLSDNPLGDLFMYVYIYMYIYRFMYI
jgi:hypothetical protein